jgi:hypothetical protein
VIPAVRPPSSFVWPSVAAAPIAVIPAVWSWVAAAELEEVKQAAGAARYGEVRLAFGSATRTYTTLSSVQA